MNHDLNNSMLFFPSVFFYFHHVTSPKNTIYLMFLFLASWSESLHTVWKDSEGFTPSWRSLHVQRASTPWRYCQRAAYLSAGATECIYPMSQRQNDMRVCVCVCVCVSKELLSLCGGDLSSALPWLELHTLNFSYNSIVCLDQSLVRQIHADASSPAHWLNSTWLPLSFCLRVYWTS